MAKIQSIISKESTTYCSVPSIPDDTTLPQFMLDVERPCQHPYQSWLIDSSSGKETSKYELQDRVWALANALDYKFKLGDTETEIVAIISPNHTDYPTVLWSSHRLGAAVIPMNPAFGAEELIPQLREAKPTLLFVHEDAFSQVKKASMACGISSERMILVTTRLQQCAEDEPDRPTTVEDLIQLGVVLKPTHSFVEKKLYPGEGRTKAAVLFPSSGTTGVPKLVILSHYALIANILQANAHDSGTQDFPIPIDRQRYRPGDISCATLPFFHVFGLLSGLLRPLSSGMSAVITPKFSLTGYVKTITKYSVTHLQLVPPMAVLLTKTLEEDCTDLQTVKMVVIGGAPLNNQLLQRFSRLAPRAVVGQIYGLTEAATLTAPSISSQISALSNPEYGIQSASVGMFLPGVCWKVIGDNGSLVGRGERGELWIMSPSNANGYTSSPEAASETFVKGWVRTGDEVFVDENDEVFIVQRLKDFMKVKGFRVDPAEIEGHLIGHPDVLECCVVPVPDEISGEVPKAFVIVTERATKRLLALEDIDAGVAQLKLDLMQYVAEHKVRYKHLEGGVEFCEHIPKTASGKLLRRALRDRAH